EDVRGGDVDRRDLHRSEPYSPCMGGSFGPTNPLVGAASLNSSASRRARFAGVTAFVVNGAFSLRVSITVSFLSVLGRSRVGLGFRRVLHYSPASRGYFVPGITVAGWTVVASFAPLNNRSSRRARRDGSACSCRPFSLRRFIHVLLVQVVVDLQTAGTYFPYAPGRLMGKSGALLSDPGWQLRLVKRRRLDGRPRYRLTEERIKLAHPFRWIGRTFVRLTLSFALSHRDLLSQSNRQLRVLGCRSQRRRPRRGSLEQQGIEACPLQRTDVVLAHLNSFFAVFHYGLLVSLALERRDFRFQERRERQRRSELGALEQQAVQARPLRWIGDGIVLLTHVTARIHQGL